MFSRLLQFRIVISAVLISAFWLTPISSIAQDLIGLGIKTPEAVKSMDPLATYDALRTPMGERHDPCLLDTFMAAHAFMNGGSRQPWWNFTERRKALLK